MTREEEIRKSAFEYIKSDAVKAGEEYTSFGDFINGAKWADAHPHWISVKDELPMELEPVLAAFGNHYARVCFYNGGKWYIDAGVMSDEAFGVSHWMQISPPPKEGGEE